MSLEDFREPRTPESRTPYVLLYLGVIGLVSNLWSSVRDNPLVGALAAVATAAGLSYLVIRYLRRT